LTGSWEIITFCLNREWRRKVGKWPIAFAETMSVLMSENGGLLGKLIGSMDKRVLKNVHYCLVLSGCVGGNLNQSSSP